MNEEAREDEEDGEPLIWVCRDIEGDHVGGPECFCCPRAFTVDELGNGVPDEYNRPS